MGTVWVLEEGMQYDGNIFLGVFSTRDKAISTLKNWVEAAGMSLMPYTDKSARFVAKGKTRQMGYAEYYLDERIIDEAYGGE